MVYKHRMKNGKIRHYQSKAHYQRSLKGLFAKNYQKKDHSRKISKLQKKNKRIRHRGIGKVSSGKKACAKCKRKGLSLKEGKCKLCAKEFKAFKPKIHVHVMHMMEGYNREDYGTANLTKNEIIWLLSQGYTIMDAIGTKRPYGKDTTINIISWDEYTSIAPKRPDKLFEDHAEGKFPSGRLGELIALSRVELRQLAKEYGIRGGGLPKRVLETRILEHETQMGRMEHEQVSN